MLTTLNPKLNNLRENFMVAMNANVYAIRVVIATPIMGLFEKGAIRKIWDKRKNKG